ncbi:MAG: biotin/lipoyl-containing protein [Myxococcota bacterium]
MKHRVGEQEAEEAAAKVERMPDGSLRVRVGERVVTAWVHGDQVWIGGRVRAVKPVAPGAAESAGAVTPPMPGTVTKVFVAAGDAVKRGDKLLAVTAMKMETVLRAPKDGVVRAVLAAPGASVKAGEKLVEIE